MQLKKSLWHHSVSAYLSAYGSADEVGKGPLPGSSTGKGSLSQHAYLL